MAELKTKPNMKLWTHKMQKIPLSLAKRQKICLVSSPGLLVTPRMYGRSTIKLAESEQLYLLASVLEILLALIAKAVLEILSHNFKIVVLEKKAQQFIVTVILWDTKPFKFVDVLKFMTLWSIM